MADRRLSQAEQDARYVRLAYVIEKMIERNRNKFYRRKARRRLRASTAGQLLGPSLQMQSRSIGGRWRWRLQAAAN